MSADPSCCHCCRECAADEPKVKLLLPRHSEKYCLQDYPEEPHLVGHTAWAQDANSTDAANYGACSDAQTTDGMQLHLQIAHAL